LDPIVTQWHRTIHNRLPELRTTYDASIMKLIKSFISAMVDSVTKICPELSDALHQWQESSTRTIGSIQKNTITVFDETIQDAARAAHRLVKPKVKDCWKPIYDQCGAESGTLGYSFPMLMERTKQYFIGSGHFRRNQISHSEHVKNTAAPMYRKGSTAIRAAFKKLWDSLPADFNQGTKPASTQIQEEFDLMLNNHTLRDEMELAENSECLTKAKLQQEIQDHFRSMNSAWGHEVDVEIAEVEEEPEEEIITIDDLDRSKNDDELDYDPDEFDEEDDE
jgi:hypothetical protein